MKNRHFLAIVVMLLFLGSCASNRLVYIQEEVESKQSGVEYEKHKREYLLKPGDILDISFNTTNEELQGIFGKQNSGNVSAGSQGQGAGFYLRGYTVSDSGYIELPTAGKIHVKGKNIYEAERSVQKRLDEYFKGARATVKLVSFKVTFFGEVAGKGPHFFYQDELNLIEALSVAGGVTNYADLREILILRKTDNGRKTLKIDLTDRQILASEDFYLMPNDMVYIKPIPTRNLRIDVNDYFFYISTITSTLSTLFLILNY